MSEVSLFDLKSHNKLTHRRQQRNCDPARSAYTDILADPSLVRLGQHVTCAGCGPRSSTGRDPACPARQASVQICSRHAGHAFARISFTTKQYRFLHRNIVAGFEALLNTTVRLAIGPVCSCKIHHIPQSRSKCRFARTRPESEQLHGLSRATRSAREPQCRCQDKRFPAFA